MNVFMNIMNDLDKEIRPFDNEEISDEALREKLIDALTPGYAVEFDPEEAEKAGAFVEDALNEHDAIESSIDLNINDSEK